MALPRSLMAGIAACVAAGIYTSALAQRPIESAPRPAAAPELKRALPAQAQPAQRDIRRLPAARLLITTANILPAASRGKSYSHALTTSGVAPHVWSVIRGRLPAGLTLSSAGVLSGVPIATGKFSFTVRVADSTQRVATKMFVLAVVPPPVTVTPVKPKGPPAAAGGATSQPIVPKTIAVGGPLSATGFAAAGPPVVPKTIAVGGPLSATGFATAGPSVVPKTITVGATLTAVGF